MWQLRYALATRHNFHEKIQREGKREEEKQRKQRSKDSERSIASAIEIDLHRIRFRQILTFIGDNATDQSTGIK